MIKSKRKKKCKVCGTWFSPFNTIQATCLRPSCILEWNQRLEAKKLKRRHRADKERIKPRGKLMSEAQQAFNAYVRLRDATWGCVSCDRPSTWSGQWHASHYRSVGGHPEVRFDEANCHRSCSPCNNFLSGNLTEYRIKLIGRIGLVEVERLEGPHEPKHYSSDDLRAIKVNYRHKRRELKRCRD